MSGPKKYINSNRCTLGWDLLLFKFIQKHIPVFDKIFNPSNHTALIQHLAVAATITLPPFYQITEKSRSLVLQQFLHSLKLIIKTIFMYYWRETSFSPVLLAFLFYFRNLSRAFPSWEA